MFQTCKSYPICSDPKSSLVMGNSSYRTSGLDTHWRSRQHLMAANRQHERDCVQEGQPLQGPMDVAIRALNDTNRAVLKKLFNTAYFVL